MYTDHAHLCVCLSLTATFPHYCTDPDVTWGMVRALVVQYWVELQSVYRFHYYDNIAPNAKCQRVLVLALCQVYIRFSWCHCHPIISCFIKVQNGLTFLVPAYPGCPGKEAVKRVSYWLQKRKALNIGKQKKLVQKIKIVRNRESFSKMKVV